MLACRITETSLSFRADNFRFLVPEDHRMTGASPLWQPKPDPFVGARSFEVGDHELFFGRTYETNELTRLWQQNRVTILYGHAGVGKTSLLRAGAFAKLSAEGANVLPIGRFSYRSSVPSASLPDENPCVFALLSSWAPTASAARIASLSIEDFLRRNERADRSGQPVPTMIAIDQAERLFQDSEIHISRRRRFLDELIEAMNRRPAARLLLCVRTDHLDDVLPIAKEVADDSCVSFPLEPFGQDTAIEAARGPIERFGRALPLRSRACWSTSSVP
ncbi:ATP-binding protein [Nonomuraea thailandensis]